MKLSIQHPLHFRFNKKTSIATIDAPYSVQQFHKEFKHLLGLNLERGLLISVLVHLALIGTYYGVQYYKEFDADVPVVKIRILKYSDLGPPPSITNSMMAPVIGVAQVSKPSVGTPVPVPDAEINPEQTIATQTEMSQVSSEVLDEGGNGAGEFRIEDDVKIENDEPGMNEFTPVEKSPQIVYAEKPKYPDVARRANMEGYVWVKILVDKTGKPKKAVVIKESGGELFNEAAVNAAMKYKFTPAVMNTGPVTVWVAIKFNFQLIDRN